MTRAPALAALALAVAAGACGKSKAACKTEVADLMQFLHAMNRSVPLPVPDDVHLAMRTPLPHADVRYSAQVVVIGPHGLVYQGAPIEPAALGAALAAGRAKLEDDIAQGRTARAHPPDPQQVYLVIDAGAQWSRVVAVAELAATAGVTHVGFVVGAPSPVQPPPRTSVDDELDPIIKPDTSGNAATKLAEIASREVKPCAALARVFGAVSGEDGGDKGAEIIEGTGPALIECTCAADVPKIRTLLWRVAGNAHPAAPIDVELVREATDLELPATTTWADAQARLQPGAKLWLVVAAAP